MAHHSFQRVIFALLTLFVASTAATIEETEADGLVSPGATGNRVVLSITNPSATLTAENLTLQVESRPRWLEVTEIRTDSEGPLAPGQARRFEVVFDVADDADVDLIGHRAHTVGG